MPISYLGRVVEKTGLQATLKKVDTISVTTKYNIVDNTTITYTDETISYLPTTVDYKLRSTPSGWEDDTDELIWVDPELDISNRDKINYDVVVIGPYAYMVSHTRHMTWQGHEYKLVGLAVIAKEALP